MFAEFHGRSVTTTAIDPMKNTRIRQITLFVAVLLLFTGSADSPAATATISDPINENITTVIPSSTELIPFGINPPCPTKFEVPGASVPGTNPKNNS